MAFDDLLYWLTSPAGPRRGTRLLHLRLHLSSAALHTISDPVYDLNMQELLHFRQYASMKRMAI
jgi:hypothetical protein